MLRLEPALVELDALDRRHVERAEVPEEVVHVVRPEAVVLDAVLVGPPAADEQAGGRFIAARHAGQQLERAKQVAFSEARQRGDLLRLELDTADVIRRVEQGHVGKDDDIGGERGGQREVHARVQRPADLHDQLAGPEAFQSGADHDASWHVPERQCVIAVAVGDRDVAGPGHHHGGAREHLAAGSLHRSGYADLVRLRGGAGLCGCRYGRPRHGQRHQRDQGHARGWRRNGSPGAAIC